MQAEEHECLRKGFQPNQKPGRSSRKRGYPMIEPKEKKWPLTDAVRGHFSVSEAPCLSLWERWPASAGRRGFCRAAWAGAKKEGRKNPPQHVYHITPPSASQRRNGSRSAKSVACTKTDVCIWETFHLEKFGFPWYSIGTKRRYLNSNPSGGLPKATGNNGNQSDFTSK